MTSLINTTASKTTTSKFSPFKNKKSHHTSTKTKTIAIFWTKFMKILSNWKMISMKITSLMICKN